MKKVYLETFGCQMNVSDSERIATTLEADGYEITPDEDAAAEDDAGGRASILVQVAEQRLLERRQLPLEKPGLGEEVGDAHLPLAQPREPPAPSDAETHIPIAPARP